MLHNCIFVDFFGLTEGMKDCQITNRALLLLCCVSSCFSGYVYFTTTPYTFWTATISFLLTEGMECCSMLQFVAADALFLFQQSQLPTTSMRFGLIWSNYMFMKLYASSHSHFLLTEGMECCFILQFVSADASFFSLSNLNYQQLACVLGLFEIMICMKLYASPHLHLSLHGLQHGTSTGCISIYWLHPLPKYDEVWYIYFSWS